ncbi:CBS domain-containing protein [bacterium]|jgi:CBS domain-containing protein|nr:CBS domain-containing protein [bacterium]NBX50754.1 CBS domain-containing protein [bacterium]
MLVRDVMQQVAVMFPMSLSWREAAEQLLQCKASSACVMDSDGKLVGILSEKDLFRGMFPDYGEWLKEPHAFLDAEELEDQARQTEGKLVRDVMSKRLITTTPQTPLLRVGGIMVASGVHHVPVVDGEKVVGMVGRGDIYRAILEKYFLRKK